MIYSRFLWKEAFLERVLAPVLRKYRSMRQEIHPDYVLGMCIVPLGTYTIRWLEAADRNLREPPKAKAQLSLNG